MKARHEFETDEAYDDYLLVYFMGQLVAGITANPAFHPTEEFMARNVRSMARGLVTELKNGFDSDAPNR